MEKLASNISNFVLYTEVDLKLVMKAHSFISILIGVGALILPHGLHSVTLGKGTYNHMAHEFIRLYGCLSLGIGWIVWSTKDIRDGRLMRAISETFSIIYILQSIAMLRAQFSDPNGHSLIHWLIAILFFLVGSMYAYIRYVRKIKSYELPGSVD